MSRTTSCPTAPQNNIGVIAYSPMASGLLTGAMTRERIANFPQDDWRRTHEWFQEPQLTKNLALADRLGQIGAAMAIRPPRLPSPGRCAFQP